MVGHDVRIPASTMKRGMGAVALTILSLWSAGMVTANPPSQLKAFVRAEGPHFLAGDQRFYVAGANCYYLGYWASDVSTNALSGRTYREDADRFLVRCRDMGINVLRVWAFNDGPHQWSMQPQPGEHNEQSLQGLDYLLKRGHDLGIRYIFTLVNYWDDFGGMRWYATNSVPGQAKERFYTDAQCQAWYRGHIDVLTGRTNTFTGIPYRDDPAIFAWQLANEARNPGERSSMVLRNWVFETATYIKSRAPNQMVSTGEEGWTAEHPWEGTRWEWNAQSPDIDYLVAHAWPEQWAWLWGDTPEARYTNAMAWVRDRAALATTRFSKPFVLSEYGMIKPRDGEFGRHAFMTGFFDEIYNSAAAGGAGAGLLVWMLEAEGSDHVDSFEIRIDDPADAPTLALLQGQAKALRSLYAPAITRVERIDGSPRLQWTESIGQPIYTIQVSSNLTAWEAVDTTEASAWVDPTPAPVRYYRIRPFWE